MDSFSSYAAMGFSVMPLRGKLPIGAWKNYQTSHAPEWLLAQWDATSHNIGIITGFISGILVVDIDGVYPEDWPAMPETWTVKTRNGHHYYFNLPDDFDVPNSASKLADKVDIRANGGYVVAVPSRHPDGGFYEWVEGLSPAETELADIPDFIIKLLKSHESKVVPIRPAQDTASHSEPYIQKAIDNELGLVQSAGEGTRNDQLNRSAFALAQFIPHGLSESKISDLLESAALNAGLSPGETKKTIASGITSGKTNPRDIPPSNFPPPVEEPPEIVKNILRRQGKKNEQSEISPHLITDAPNMIGEMTKWILDTSMYPLPVLALAASIPAIGNVMAHRIKTETNLRTNFFTVGIAESGGGKDWARKCIARLCGSTSMIDTLLGDPQSATAVINAVNRSDGQGLMRIDEIGQFLNSIKGGNSASHNRMITTNFIHMYNYAGEMFIGGEYANNDLSGGRSDIDQPCLNIYASSVPGVFYSSLSQQEATNGFLSRWLIFETSRFDVDPHLDLKSLDPPDSLVDQVCWWRQQPKCGDDAHGSFSYTKINPPTVKFSDSARKSYHAFVRSCRVLVSESDDLITKAFWNRTAEHAAKLSLVGHKGNYIQDDVFEWAVELSKELTISAINKIRANVADNEYEADLQKIMKIVLTAGAEGVSQSQITRATRGIDRRKRQDLLASLIEAGDIEKEEIVKDSSKRGFTMFRSVV